MELPPVGKKATYREKIISFIRPHDDVKSGTVPSSEEACVADEEDRFVYESTCHVRSLGQGGLDGLSCGQADTVTLLHFRVGLLYMSGSCLAVPLVCS
jgi:hypothetical protein